MFYNVELEGAILTFCLEGLNETMKTFSLDSTPLGLETNPGRLNVQQECQLLKRDVRLHHCPTEIVTSYFKLIK
jgi:hypothetical protein